MDQLMNSNQFLAGKPVHSVSSVARSIQQGALTAREYVAGYIAAIQKKNPQVHALVAWDEEAILRQAEAIDRRQDKGVLAGIPIAIKDVIDVSGLPTAYGAHHFFKTTPNHDASCVALLKAAGAVIIGKAATAEFAFSAPSRARNPHHLAHTPGGSSSGSAAGVAADMFPLALGTQTGGSVIRPAAFCGVFGFKPTFGLVGRAGMRPFAESFDTIGWFGHDIEDIQCLLSVLASEQAQPTTRSVEGSLRVGFCRTPFWSQASAAMRHRVEQIADLFEASEVTLSFDLEQVSKDHKKLMAIEMARALRPEFLQHSAQLSPALLALIEQGLTYTHAQELQSLNHLAQCRAALDQQFSEFDLLLAPAAPGSAPATLTHTGDSIFNRMWSALHVPCLSMPVGTAEQGLPVGIQLIGRRYADQELLQASRALYQRYVAGR